jgi:hypothetical protein
MKRLILSFILIALLSLSGCIQELRTKEEESDAIAEYMAGLLLKYNNYDRALIPVNDFEDSFDDSSSDKQNDKKDKSDNTNASSSSDKASENKGQNAEAVTLTDLFGQKNFDITYSGFKLTEFYPEDYDDTYISLEAGEGKLLLVIKFKIKNITKKTERLNLGETVVKYRLNVDGMSIDKPWFTVLENDLQYFDMNIKGEATAEAVLVYQISKEADTDAMKLSISKDGKEMTVQLK